MKRQETVLMIQGREGFSINVNNFSKVRDYVVERSPLFGIKREDYSMRRIGNGCVEFVYREKVSLERLGHLVNAINSDDDLRCEAAAYRQDASRPAI
ncbi:MAG TPA: hypothetical protein VHA12_03075 [Candidatus Nanoarchaeia archaeon]|nr:hypothetical protein [Candidatus Nanoarchaeia archaeon]